MNFSLKTFLITLCVGGAVIGVMGRLLIVRPEIFLRVLAIGSTVVPFLLAVGTIIWFGLREKRRWNVVAWGLFLLLAPLTVQFALLLLWPTRDPLRVLATHRLIGQRLPNQVDQPWIWRELERRLKNGQLVGREVDDAVRELISYMKTSSPKGWNRPLSWQRDFLAAAIEAKLVSEEVFVDLCDAFFGTQPTIKPIPFVTERQAGFGIYVDLNNAWSRDSGLGVQRLWNVTQVLIDGVPAKIGSERQLDDHWIAFCNTRLAPGEHVIQIEVEQAYVDDDKLLGIRGARLPPKQWPTAKKRWVTTVTAPVTVVQELNAK